MKSDIVNGAPAEVTYPVVHAAITKFPVLLAARIPALIDMLLGYLGSKTEAAAVAFATRARHLFSAEWKPSRRPESANIEAGETSSKQTGYVLLCQLIDV